MEELTIENIKAKNFGVYKEVDLYVGDKDIIGILGTYKGAKERSNRSGKSLIMEMILYNLIGKTRYKSNKEMIRRGEKAMSVEVEYKDSRGKVYKIKRGVDDKGKGLIEVDWTEKSKEAEEAISELFGINKEDFVLMNFFKQQDINGFMDLPPSKKSEHVMQWMDNTHWKTREALVKEDVKALKDRIKENDTVLKALQADLELEENLDIEIDSVESSLKRKKKELLDKNKEIDLVNKKLSSVKDKAERGEKELRKLKLELRENKEKLAKYKKKKEGINQVSRDLVSAREELSEVVKPSKQDKKYFVELKAKYKAELEQLDTKLSKLKKHSGGICPILSESCDRIKCSSKDLKLIENEKEELSSKIKEATQAIKEFNEYHGIEDVVNSLQKDFDFLKNSIEDYKVEDRREKIEGEIEELEQAMSFDNSKLKKKRQALNEEKADIDDEISRLNNRIGGLNQRKEASKESLVKIETLQNQNETSRFKLETLLYVQKMFSKTGIPASEIENAFKEVESDINYVLKELKSGLSVSFSPDKELNKWEPVCTCGFTFYKGYRKNNCEECGAEREKARVEELSLKIIENGKEANFEGDSGGGKTLISYAVRIALSLLKKRRNKSKFPVLFLDEVDSALDPHLAATITDSITKVLTRKLGYKQIFMVSHKKEIQNAIPNILLVTKLSDYSKAEFV